MSRKEPGFAERLQTAAKAKQAQLEKIRAAAPANDAQSAERQAAWVETARARQIRMAERASANRITAERRDAERAAEKARQACAVTEENARKDAERVAQAEADAALKKGSEGRARLQIRRAQSAAEISKVELFGICNQFNNWSHRTNERQLSGNATSSNGSMTVVR